MTDIENKKAAREARQNAAFRTGQSHSTAEMAEASMRRYFAGESYRRRPSAPASSHLVPDELAAVTEELRQAFPAADPARVRTIVEHTYRELAASAKVTDHLIPLTLHEARARLEAE